MHSADRVMVNTVHIVVESTVLTENYMDWVMENY